MVIKSTSYDQDKAMLNECIAIDAADFVRFVGKNYNPDDVFESKALAQWAIDNGYVLPEEE